MTAFHFRSLYSSIALFSVFQKLFLQSLPEHSNHVSGLNLILMDDSPFAQTLKLEIFISTAKKSILNLVKLQNIVKCGKCSPVKFASFV